MLFHHITVERHLEFVFKKKKRERDRDRICARMRAVYF